MTEEKTMHADMGDGNPHRDGVRAASTPDTDHAEGYSGRDYAQVSVSLPGTHKAPSRKGARSNTGRATTKTSYTVDPRRRRVSGRE